MLVVCVCVCENCQTSNEGNVLRNCQPKFLRKWKRFLRLQQQKIGFKVRKYFKDILKVKFKI